MATVTKSIGTSSRDYSTITAWEADLDNTTPYDPGDAAVGECYNDSVFAESVTINGGGTIGLASIRISVASGERHDGTAGTGARIVASADGGVSFMSGTGIAQHIEWIEIDANGKEYSLAQRSGATTSTRWIIVHDWSGTDATPELIWASGSSSADYLNIIVYDLYQSWASANGSACLMRTQYDGVNLYNITAYKVYQASATVAAHCIEMLDRADEYCKNVVACDPTGAGTTACFSPASPSNATMDYNASSDSTASGANSLTTITTANQFVSTTNGSEDLHLKTGANCINEGVDLGTTPTGVNIDIDGRDRDSEGDIWDIGASEYVFYYIKKYYRIGKKVLRA